MTKDSKDLAVVNEFVLPALNNELGAAISEEMEGLNPVDLITRIKIPSGGAIAFEVPGDDPENPDMVKELIGVIVDKHPINAYWAAKYEGQNNPPDCSSMDGVSGIGNPGGDCKNCPYNQWGTATNPDGTPGKGKACKNMHRIYLLRSGEAFPLLLTLPPTSIKAFSTYIAKSIVAKGMKSYSVVTRISLKKAQNSGGITYSQAQFGIDEKLSPDAVKVMSEYSKGIKSVTRALSINESDYEEAPNEDFPVGDEKNIPF